MANNENTKEIIKDIVKNLTDNFSFNSLKDLFRSLPNKTFKPIEEDISYLYDDNNNDKNIFEDIHLFGELELEEGDFCIVVCRVKNELKERTSRKKQYDLAKKFLKRENRYIGGFFIFYDEKSNFRFSLVYEIYFGKGKRGFSNFKRFTYYVSKDQTNKTFIEQFSKSDFSTISSIIEAFSVEKVTKEFYKQIQTWYYWAISRSFFPNDKKINEYPENATNIIRLITRLTFIWFIKQKDLVPDTLFDKDELKKTIKDFCDYNNDSNHYYNAILQNLFFATLNTPIESREWAEDKGFHNNKENFGLKNKYRYENTFLISKEKVLNLFKDIPFLNGGLFECLDEDKVYIDGFSRNEKKRAKIPDELFFLNEEKEVDLSKYGLNKNEKVKGIIEIFKEYNWTTDESTPIDEEVALDPELLGKIFENLLAAYNPETHETARKSTGSYYTPREIVNYMVDESLKEELKIKLPNIDENKLDILISYSDEIPDFSDQEKKDIISVIDNLKILDPACGSGAFPMAILHKLVYILQKLDPDNKFWRETQEKKALEEANKVFKENDKDEREKRLIEISEAFDEKINYPDYARKLYLIENCIYGVDIQPIAVQISKLRFFISLVLDQKFDKEKNNFGILPLPHLETKFVCANALIGLDKHDISLFSNPELEDKLKEIRHKYFTIKDRKQKQDLENQDYEIRKKIKESLEKQNIIGETAEKIASFNIFSQIETVDWFDPEWMFGVKDGFDIVIGNPPYIQLQKAYSPNLKYADLYKDLHYKTFDRTGDIYCLFYEKGINLLKQNGLLSYITSNKWMRAGYGQKLREFFTKYNPIKLIDLGPGVFENATVDTNILIIQKSSNLNILKAITLQKEDKENIRQSLKEKGVILTKLTSEAWFIGTDAEQRLKEKIEKIGKPLKDWDVKIYRGVLTGLNEAFIIDTEKRNEILANCKDKAERQRTEAIIKPILRGRDIKRYHYEWAGLWVIIIPAGWTNENRNNEKPEDFIQKSFPSLMQHLKQFEAKAIKRDDQGDYWWELRHCAYYPEFEKEKVVYSEIVRQPQFFYDTERFYVEATSFLMTGECVKYICGLLNSSPVTYFFKNWYAGGGLGEEGYRYKKAFLENLPIPPITSSNEPIVKQIEALVDKILAAKKQNPQANTIEWEKEIDGLVYRLYDLTEEEIEIIEGGR